MAERVGLDTNILLRWLLDGSIIGDDAPNQTGLISALVTNPDYMFFVNNIVIAETIWILANRAKQSRKIISDVMHKLLFSINVAVEDRSVLENALQSYVTGKGDFADHLIGETNRQNGCSRTFTFDKAAAKSPLFEQLS